MKIRLFCILIAATLSLSSCSFSDTSKDSCKVDISLSQAILSQTEDAGEEYQNSLIFMGESTTYHLKAQKVLSGGENTAQVWGAESGTMNLDMTTKSIKIVYPETKEKMTPAEAAKRKQPEYIVLTFGLNGAVQNIKRGKEYYKACYLSLINSLLDASPKTKIIIQSAFPIAKNMDMSHYSVDVPTLNSYIDTINTWSLELAEDIGARYLATSEILKDTEGFLYAKYQAPDGYHLNRSAYIEILKYIRTHAYR